MGKQYLYLCCLFPTLGTHHHQVITRESCSIFGNRWSFTIDSTVTREIPSLIPQCKLWVHPHGQANRLLTRDIFYYASVYLLFDSWREIEFKGSWFIRSSIGSCLHIWACSLYKLYFWGIWWSTIERNSRITHGSGRLVIHFVIPGEFPNHQVWHIIHDSIQTLWIWRHKIRSPHDLEAGELKLSHDHQFK